MSDRDSHEVKDAKWESIDNNGGEIRFRKRRGITKIHSFFRCVAIIVVAALSGGVGGAYIINKKLLNNNNNKSYDKQLFESRNIDIQRAENSKKSINKSVDGTNVIGIANKVNGFLGVNGGIVCSQNNRVQGFYISEVERGGSAALAGIKPTDILLEIDNTNIKKYEDLLKAIDKYKIGDSVKCKIWRNGKTEEFNVKFTEIKGSENK